MGGVDAATFTDVDTVVANPASFIDAVLPDVHTMLGLPVPASCVGCVDIAVSKATSRRLSTSRRLAAGDLKMDVTVKQEKIVAASLPPVTATVVQEKQVAVGFSSPGQVTGTPTYSPPTSEAVAGNGVCELGEDSSNSLGDCLEAKACPGAASGTPCGGFGICIAVSGQCSCFDGKGHAGEDCSTCKTGFLKDSSNQQCKFQVALLPPGPPGVDWALSVGVLAGVALFAFVVARWRNKFLATCGLIAPPPRETTVKTAAFTQI